MPCLIWRALAIFASSDITSVSDTDLQALWVVEAQRCWPRRREPASTRLPSNT
jgi:hypothetical protein